VENRIKVGKWEREREREVGNKTAEKGEAWRVLYVGR
jgi:hypothetical protein